MRPPLSPVVGEHFDLALGQIVARAQQHDRAGIGGNRFRQGQIDFTYFAAHLQRFASTDPGLVLSYNVVGAAIPPLD